MRRAALMLAALALTSQARSATFAMVNGTDGRPAARIWGDIEPGDHTKFAAFVKSNPQFYSIILSSDGGAVEPAVRIGNFAHILGLQTVVSSGYDCASACALIWVAGAKRSLEPGAKVGFHGVFTIENGAAQTSGSGNALVGAYLARMGYGDQAIAYMTAQPPTGMAWLDAASAHALGLDFDIEQMWNPPPKPIVWPVAPYPKPSGPVQYCQITGRVVAASQCPAKPLSAAE